MYAKSLNYLFLFSLFLSMEALSWVQVPDNAHVDPFTYQGWACDSGYRQTGNVCKETTIPLNASYDKYTRAGWSCDRGYKQLGSLCNKVFVPQNAELDYYGSGWVCRNRYVKREDACIHAKYATDSEIKRLLIDESLSRYHGSCPCPYFTDSAGRRCGRRSAYNRAGGFSPMCFPNDVTDEQVEGYRKQFQ